MARHPSLQKSALPEEIRRALDAVVARRRRVAWRRGLWLVAAVTVAGVLSAMGLDALMDLEATSGRVALSLAVAAAVGVVAWRELWLPLRRRITLAAAARMVELRHPEMEERLSTAVELLGRGENIAGSRELLDEVVRSAVLDAGAVRPEAEVSDAAARWPRRWALATLAIAALVAVLFPLQSGMLFLRVVAPLANFGNAAASDLEALSGDVVLMEGEPLTLKARASTQAPVFLERRANGRTVSREKMLAASAEGEGVWSLSFPAVTESFGYRLTSGRARTRDHEVRVLPRPDIQTLEVDYEFPSYTGLPPRTDVESSGDILGVAGTRVRVRAGLSARPERVALSYDQTENAAPPVEVAEAGGRWTARWEAVLESGANWRWQMTPFGLRDVGGRGRSGTLRALPDLPPGLVIDSPVERELTLRPNEVLPVLYSASDDFGLAGVLLRVQPEGAPAIEVRAPLPEATGERAGMKLFSGRAELDLSRLPLSGVGTLRVRLEVTDTLPAEAGGPQRAVSEDILIRLNWGARSYAEQTVEVQERQIARELEQLRNALSEQRNQAAEKARQMQHRQELRPEHLQQLDELTGETARSAERLEELAEKMQHSVFAEQAPELERAADQMVRPAAESLQQIPQTDVAEQRARAAEDARTKLDEAVRMAEQALQALRQEKPERQQTAQLASLAQQQQQLADAARDAAPHAAHPPAADSPGTNPPEAPGAQENSTAENHAAQLAQTAPAPTSGEPESAPPQEAPGNQQASQEGPPQEAPGAQQMAQAATPPQETGPPLDFERWQEQQQKVAAQSEQLSHQAQAQNPAFRQQSLAAAAQQAADLARQAEALAARQEELAAAAEDSAAEPAAQAQQARAEADLGQQSQELARALEQFRQESGPWLAQNAPAQIGAAEASSDLARAAEQAMDASRQFAQAAAATEEAAADGSRQPTPDDPAASPPAADGSGGEASAGADPRVAGEPTAQSRASAGAESIPGNPSEAGMIAQEATSTDALDPGSVPAPAAGEPSEMSGAEGRAEPALPEPLREALQAAGESLQSSAQNLAEVAEALHGQSEAVAVEAQALAAAAGQTRAAAQAAEQARQGGRQAAEAAAREASQAGHDPQQASSQAEQRARNEALAAAAAEPAQQAANNLAVAAATAMQAQGIPQQAMDSQNMGQTGDPTREAGQPGQAQNGDGAPSTAPGEASDKAGLQATQAHGLPPELERLGLTADDWVKIRGLVRGGSDASGGERIPAEYRELVKGYFRALAAPPEKK